MFAPSNIFENIPDDITIWRYMSTDKFIHLLRTQTLYLCRVDKLYDKYECSLTETDKKYFYFSNNEYWEKDAKRHFINCWAESDHELYMMWNTYGVHGIAIKSTVGHLKSCMKDDVEHIVRISRVKYIEPETGSSQIPGMPLNALLIPMTKRKYYEQEKEIRILYNMDTIETRTCIELPINVKELIDEIKVYPGASEYFLNTVNSELKSHGIELSATYSNI